MLWNPNIIDMGYTVGGMVVPVLRLFNLIVVKLHVNQSFISLHFLILHNYDRTILFKIKIDRFISIFQRHELTMA